MLAAVFFTAASSARAGDQISTLDHRVSAIPAARLLSAPPAALVDPARQAGAQSLARYTRPSWFFWIGMQILVLLYLWRSGTAARVRDSLKRSLPSLVAVRFVFGALLALALQVAALPAEFYHYRILRIIGISTEAPAGWWSDILLGAAIEMALVGLAVVVIMWLVDRSHLWWIYVILGVFATSFFLSFVYPLAVEPLFNRFTLLPKTTALAMRIHELSLKAGIGDPPVYIMDISRRSRAGNAFVAGIGPSKRIVLGDTLLQSATENEIVFMVAHELGHDVRHDTFKGAIFAAWIFIFGAALAVLIADRIGFRRDDDPLARLTLVGALLGCMYVLFLPAINGYSRTVESAADAYALQIDPDHVAGTRLFVRLSDESLSLLCPGRLARIYWYTHPPIGTRISAINGQPNPCP
ncbi:MAG: M48 family metalloprotease [Candidatus Eremiobacteraeota bacterium]|nr:M48 family metalloprotease [Candidatus Eremiobacteraeota bacterium]